MKNLRNEFRYFRNSNMSQNQYIVQKLSDYTENTDMTENKCEYRFDRFDELLYNFHK